MKKFVLVKHYYKVMNGKRVLVRAHLRRNKGGE